MSVSLSESKKPIILSGIQPTNKLTLGNYLGAIKNWVTLQDQYQCYFMAVNQHAITARQDPKELRENTWLAVATYLAAGVDPQHHQIFIQSQVAEHAELAWVLNCFSNMGEISRMTQYKDKSSRAGQQIPVGLFTYPLLMAADILLYDTNLVPVGADQKQHVELTRDIAQRMNGLFGEDTFVVPEVFIAPIAARIMDLQEPSKKMSKSASSEMGAIYLGDDEKQIEKKFKKATTDSGQEITYEPDEKPGIKNLLDIQSAITGKSVETLVAGYAGKLYGHLKLDTAGLVQDELRPIWKRTQDYLSDRGELQNILNRGAQKAREKARLTVDRVYERIGFIR